MTKGSFWVGVVSKDHVDLAVAGGYAQLNHGKAGPLERMHAGDGLLSIRPDQATPAANRCRLSRPSAASARVTCIRLL